MNGVHACPRARTAPAFEKVKYPVTDDTVVPGEPGWLPPTYTAAGGFTPINFN